LELTEAPGNRSAEVTTETFYYITIERCMYVTSI
jgi:hypothetical protein